MNRARKPAWTTELRCLPPCARMRVACQSVARSQICISNLRAAEILFCQCHNISGLFSSCFESVLKLFILFTWRHFVRRDTHVWLESRYYDMNNRC